METYVNYVLENIINFWIVRLGKIFFVYLPLKTMETKRLKSVDGTIAHYINIDGINKMHNWESAALLPQGNKRAAEYWLFGMQYSKEEWEDRKKDINGTPWYKTAAGKAAGARV
jgi:hypothetical protein